MDLAASSHLVTSLTYVEETGSTNTDLVQQGGEDLTVLVAGSQTAGRGRSNREWSSPSGSSLSVSILLRPRFSNVDRLAWLPLLTGLAMARAVRSFGVEAEVKWPNDVLVNDKKICGVLSELLPDASGVVVGAGLNLTQSAAELPIDAATSLALEGVATALPDALHAYLAEFVPLYRQFVAADGDPAAGLRVAVKEACTTIGRRVRAMMPGDTQIEGTAIDIDAAGRLLISVDGSHELFAVAAGDIVHLRHN
jgi:BirA family biotin operon repressor/biotin-[acetyl-CoA-carboxylase] ligase